MNFSKKIQPPKPRTKPFSTRKSFRNILTYFRAVRRDSVNREKEAKLQFTRANVDPAEGVHWAGSYHQRVTFNKKKDHLNNWTEILFRN